MNIKWSRTQMGMTVACLLLYCFASGSLSAQHPSGSNQRVLVLVQNPVGRNPSNQNFQIYPQFSLQIEGWNNLGGVPQNPISWPTFSGWQGQAPSAVENLPAQGTGVVSNDDGSVSILNYNSESVVATYTGLTSPGAGALLSQSGRFLVAANRTASRVNVVDTQSNLPPVQLSLPGAAGVSMNPGSTVVLIFQDDSNVVYVLRHLSSTSSQTYANGNWPANAVDCEPFGLPTFCLLPLAPSSSQVSTFANQYFDRPTKAVSSADGGRMFILDSGPEAGGLHAGVTVVPAGSVLLEEGGSAVPAALEFDHVPGGVDDGIVGGNNLYVAGQQQVHAGLWAGQLTVLDTTTVPMGLGNAQPMADGTPVRMVFGDDSTLWIGSKHCNTGANQYAQSISGGGGAVNQSGCLTVVSTATNHVQYVEPYLCDLHTNKPCNSTDGSGSPETNFGFGASGDVTGIAPVAGQHFVYYTEQGQVQARSTIFSSQSVGYALVTGTDATFPKSWNGLEVAGTAVDIVLIDNNLNSDATTSSTIR